MKKSVVFLGLILATAAFAGVQSGAETEAQSGEENEAQSGVEPEAQSNMTTTDSGLQYVDREVGDGAEAVRGVTVQVHYTGWLWIDGERGDKFDSSVDRGQPFEFNLGAGSVIRGWDEGVAGMKIGGKRELIIPPDLGYGARGAGGAIPPNATLNFEVELLNIL